MLEFSSFSSGAIDTSRAVEECLAGTLGGRSGECVLLIFYTSMGHDFAAIYSAAHRLCPGATVVGTTASGVIGCEGSNESLRTLGVMAVFGPREEVAVAGNPSIVGSDPFAVSARIARELKAQAPRTTIVLFHPSAIVSLHNRTITSWQTDRTDVPTLDLHKLIYGDEEQARLVEASHDSVEKIADTLSA